MATAGMDFVALAVIEPEGNAHGFSFRRLVLIIDGQITPHLRHGHIYGADADAFADRAVAFRRKCGRALGFRPVEGEGDILQRERLAIQEDADIQLHLHGFRQGRVRKGVKPQQHTAVRLRFGVAAHAVGQPFRALGSGRHDDFKENHLLAIQPGDLFALLIKYIASPSRYTGRPAASAVSRSVGSSTGSPSTQRPLIRPVADFYCAVGIRVYPFGHFGRHVFHKIFLLRRVQKERVVQRVLLQVLGCEARQHHHALPIVHRFFHAQRYQLVFRAAQIGGHQRFRPVQGLDGISHFLHKPEQIQLAGGKRRHAQQRQRKGQREDDPSLLPHFSLLLSFSGQDALLEKRNGRKAGQPGIERMLHAFAHIAIILPHRRLPFRA